MSPAAAVGDTRRLFVRLDGDPLYAPETGVPPGTMREFALDAALQVLRPGAFLRQPRFRVLPTRPERSALPFVP